ncbi:hypothetical protein H6G96_32540 [Nostoc sp. FACHB-892]|uniref:hypothetical protein n=1 Tax=Nostoc sp. FACHB-892 TaxID=2692843 RepID=UPI001685FC88|nr:hypothetical protein [Nostoc sp. FACHB-892]MBD2730921.1 hypothetical protein [Nostoc sp. FACHB-892]
MNRQKITYVSKREPCKNCGHSHGCGELESHWLNCLRAFSQNDVAPGYRFVQPLKNGMGGLLAPDGEQQERPENYQRKLESKRIIHKLPLLSIEERDRQYRLVNENLRFIPRHREELERRGLNESEINFALERGWLRTWNSGQLIRGLSPNLAGTDSSRGIPELKHHLGFVVWAIDPQGQITGGQIANDDRSFGKHLWLSSSKQGGAGQHLPNGESPLFVWSHPEAKSCEYLFLVDGALTSFITASLIWRLGNINVAVIGAAGMGFCSSSQTFQDYLQQISPKQIIVCPDAGDVINKQALQRVKDTIALSQKLNYKTTVAWWEQITKAECDIDEFLVEGNIQNIEVVSPEKFESILSNYNEDSILRKIEKLVGSIKKAFKKPKNNNALIHRIRNRIDVQPEFIQYIPGKLPTPEEWLEMGCPRIRFKKGQQKSIWQEALVLKGWDDVLDKSHPGTGKSHNVGELQPDNLFLDIDSIQDESQDGSQNKNQDKLVYFSDSSRNITTATIEKNFAELPVRFSTGEIQFNFNRQTPLGNPFRIWSKEKQQDSPTGNCAFAKEHRALADKNLGLTASSSEGEFDSNPICCRCEFRAKNKDENGCQNSVGDEFGFKSLRKAALEKNRIRSTLTAFPEDLNARYGVFIDEAGVNLKGVSKILVDTQEFAYIFKVIRVKNLQLYEQLESIKTKIGDRLQGIIEAPDFGWDLAKTREFLGEPTSDIFDILQEVEKLTIEERSYSASVIYQGIVPVEDIQDSISKNWLLQFLQIWAGVVPGSIRITKGQIALTVRNEREQKILENAAFRVYLDATLTRQKLAIIRNISAASILEIEEEPPNYKNLTITHITGLGLGNKSRSDFCDKRIEAIEKYLAEKHNNSYASIDWKVKSDKKKNPGKICHFSGDRGSNEYSQLEAVASFGTPYPSLSGMQDTYQCLMGSLVEIDPKNKDITDANFQNWVDDEVESNIIQKVGRLRATRRAEEKLYYYHCSCHPLDLIKKAFPGAIFEKMDAFELTPEAGNQTQQSRFVVLEAARKLAEAGQDIAKLTQAELAKAAGRNQSRISQIAGQFGGGRQFLKILASLINIYTRKTNNLELSEEEGMLAQTYLPELVKLPVQEALTEIGGVARLLVNGAERFIPILQQCSPVIKAKVLGLIMSQMPEEIRQEFLEMCNFTV